MFIEWVPTEKKDTMPHFLHSINIARGYQHNTNGLMKISEFCKLLHSY